MVGGVQTHSVGGRASAVRRRGAQHAHTRLSARPPPKHAHQNNPLFLRTYVPTEDEVKFHCIVHCSLDAVEEKGGLAASDRTRAA
jgi:hypothetical protein